MRDRFKASLYGSSLVTCHLSLPLSLPLNISAGQLFELMLPVSYALTALLSAWVLMSARRLRLHTATVTLWTLGTLFFPIIVLPLYLIARSYRRRLNRYAASKTESDDEKSADENPADESHAPTVAFRWTLPLGYLVLMLSLGALYFYLDAGSVDAHLARANQARLRGETDEVIRQYRAALKLEDDAHIHNLLGQELAAAQRWEEALQEFRLAERMGENDDELSYNIAQSLDNLNRHHEALLAYEKFLQSGLCASVPHDKRCAAARERTRMR